MLYSLPELPYAHDALAPHIDAEIIELHHGKHHAAYVAGANLTTERLADARSKGDWSAIVGLQRTLAFHVSGHALHSLYWTSMHPRSAARSGGLDDQLAADFGSADGFRQHLANVALTVQG